MPLIDGKYEVIAERTLSRQQTQFDATAPDGAAVRLVWFDLEPGEEGRFERYRRAVKRLMRSGRAAVYDVVSRPGAHYVAWRLPGEARAADGDEALNSLLAQAGFPAAAADIRRSNGKPMVYDLAFDAPQPRPDAPGEAALAAAGDSTRRIRTLEPPAWSVTLAATLLLLSGAVALLVAGLYARSNDRVVTVPQLVGSEIAGATRELYELHLHANPVPVASGEPAGTVLAVEPAPGSQLRPGRSVSVTYALPPGSVTPTQVPRVVAQRYPEGVEATLAGADLSVGTVSHIPADQPAGLVISQSPPANSRIARGGTVDILVSAGPGEQLTFLPDMVGMLEEDARYFAGLAGLSPDRVHVDEVPARGEPGRVVAQSLPAYRPVSGSEAVLRLIVGTAGGPGEATEGSLGSFVGMDEEEARRMAEGLGLRVQVAEVADRALPEGVVDQQPPAGSAAPAETITLLVNLHPVPIPLPDVTAAVREPEPREVPFRWFIEPGIPDQVARVYATTLEGERHLVLVDQVRGGELLEGSWRTTYPGPVRFSLTLNDQPYGGTQLVR